MNEIQHLQPFLDNNTIPKPKKRPKTFLGIAKQPHYENVLSNIYAFFFDVNEVHKMGDLFIKSLLELIDKSKLANEKKVLQYFNEFTIETERSTDKGGRIDILLYNEDQAIIIENKVYHHIKGNDLDDYWDSIHVSGDTANKIGVILSLTPVALSSYSSWQNAKEFVNITHLEFLECVIKNLQVIENKPRGKYLVFLEDLYQNIQNISTTLMEKTDVAFYFENQKKINELVVFKKNIRAHIEEQVLRAGYGLENMEPRSYSKKSSHGNRIVNYHSSSDHNLMIMVIYGDLLAKEPTLTIKIKIEARLRESESIFKNVVTPKSINDVENGDVKDCLRVTLDEDKTFKHLAGKRYFCSKDQLVNLQETIVEILKQDRFLEMFRALESCLPQKKVN